MGTSPYRDYTQKANHNQRNEKEIHVSVSA